MVMKHIRYYENGFFSRKRNLAFYAKSDLLLCMARLRLSQHPQLRADAMALMERTLESCPNCECSAPTTGPCVRKCDVDLDSSLTELATCVARVDSLYLLAHISAREWSCALWNLQRVISVSSWLDHHYKSVEGRAAMPSQFRFATWMTTHVWPSTQPHR